jgi:hypothetical protein
VKERLADEPEQQNRDERWKAVTDRRSGTRSRTFSSLMWIKVNENVL